MCVNATFGNSQEKQETRHNLFLFLNQLYNDHFKMLIKSY